ncbi:MAG: glutamate racemase [Bacteriovoracaceae bacterium]|nr:glutamate racemase [Bacteriovoracaceae bacterium]
MDKASDNKLKIGIFDSGIGGFSILGEVHKQIPYAELYYCADDQNAPYGNLDSESISSLTEKSIEKLLSKNVHVIVLACNTATAMAIDHLRTKYELPFVGVEPYVNVIHKEGLDPAKNSVGILTTQVTGDSDRFKELINRFDSKHELTLVQSQNLAELIEKVYEFGWTEDLTQKINDEFSFIDEFKLGHLILGCTHYPLISDYISNTFNVDLISPCPYVANRVASVVSKLENFDTSNDSNHFNSFFTTKGEWEQNKFSELVGALQPFPQDV